ncbi:MAG: response regulator [Desulfobacula sp.]|jgi:DNA-binding response OmpR family regulator|nr:response regulator [Desulfobacula sp.]
MNIKAMENNKILLVDDEAGIRKVLKITLESSGYDVCLASDGETGLKIFIEKNPCIVITDIKMPGIDGIEVLKRIKNLNPETEVIMITGHGDMNLVVKSLQHEAADFITKPIDIGDLESAIKKAQERISITQNINSYMDDLESLVKEKDKKINESEKLVTIGQTIAGMSHAIKNIAGGLKGSSFVLEQGIELENREYLKQGWEMMKGNINKITKLSLDLLNYAKTTKLDFKLENPNKPAREVMQLMNHRAKEENFVFKLTPCMEKRLVFMDCDAIHNCILNLVVNAFDSFNKIANPNQTQTVNIIVERENNNIVYKIQDNGCGINDTVKKSILKDFITTKGMNGTGFGLMTTKKIIEEHDGEISFKTEEGKGSLFVVKIPLKSKV